MRRAALPVALLVGLATAVGGAVGCTTEDPAAPSRAEVSDRLDRVAAAWEGSAAARTWRDGFFLLEEGEQLPKGAFHSVEDKRAHIEGRARLSGRLPSAAAPAKVTWPDGRTAAVTALTAAEAFAEFDSRGPDDSPDPLVVTAMKPAVLPVTTSRGAARAPAWAFTLKGYDTPLIRLAVPRGTLPKSPFPLPESGLAMAGLSGVSGIRNLSADGRTFTVLAGRGSCDDGADITVREGRESVVFASVPHPRDGYSPGDLCDGALHMSEVKVVLKNPLGSRVPVSADSGAAFGTRGPHEGPTPR